MQFLGAGRGFQQLAAGLQRERIMAAVLALSGAAQALEDTMAYIRERCGRLLGKPASESGTLCHGDGGHEGGATAARGC